MKTSASALTIGLLLMLLAVFATPTVAEPVIIGQLGDGELHTAEMPSPCTSKIGICSFSTLSGPLVKDYFFTGRLVLPSLTDPDVIIILGESVIRAQMGVAKLFSIDTVWVNTVTGEAIHMWNITRGTKRWEGFTGSMAASVLVTDVVWGNYEIRIFREEEGEEEPPFPE